MPDKLTPLERMQARLADPEADHGTPCKACGMSALECQIAWVTSDELARCCAVCHDVGGGQAHV